MHIYLIGFMGTGKSTVAKEIQKITNFPRVDTDLLIVEKTKMTIPDIFEKKGEEGFRDIETETLKELSSGDSSIVSCGGGIALRKDNREIMKNSGKVIWLTASSESILKRVGNDPNRPLLKDKNTPDQIEELMSKRLPIYELAADYTVATDGKTPAQIAKEICALVDF